jgi:hypothetical protein
MGIETIAIMALAATAIGGGISAYNSYEQGQAQKKLNNFNAQVMDQAAKDKDRDALILANAQRSRNEKLMGKQRALYAKSGVSFDTGTPLMVQAEQAGQLEMAALEIETTASNEAARMRQQAVVDRMTGKAAARAGTLGAASTILGTAGSVGSTYSKQKQSGIF